MILVNLSKHRVVHSMQDKSNCGLSGLQCLNVFQKTIMILGAKSVKETLCHRQGLNHRPLTWQTSVLTNTLSIDTRIDDEILRNIII